MGTESIHHDLRFAVRQIRRTPGFTAVVLAAIAISIAANATVFSFFDAIYLRGAAGVDAGHLVAIHVVDERGTSAHDVLSAAQFGYLREHTTAFTGLAAQNWSWTWLSHGDRSIEVQGGQVSGNYFTVLGLRPHLGGFFTDQHDPSSVVLSYRTWAATFDKDPAVVGRTVRLNRRPFTIVGVAPEGFGGIYLGDVFGLWTRAPKPDGVLVARLRDDVSPNAARAELSALRGGLLDTDGQDAPRARIVLEPVRGLHPNARLALGILPSLLAAATISLLAIACANVAGLLLARADSRRREIAIRLSLGASRRRLVQQLLTESLLLAGSGGAVGVWLAVAGCRLLEQFFGYQIPDLRLALDWRVVAMSVLLSGATGLAFGLAPAYHATRSSLSMSMRERSFAGLTAIAVQTALCTVLLIGAGLLFRSMHAVLVRPGIDPDSVAHFRLRPSRLGYDLERSRSYQREVLRRVAAIPGVDSAVAARVPPEPGWCCDIDVARPGESPIKVPQNEVSPGFLTAMGIPILEGRDFAEGDRGVAIVNQALADTLWPKQRAIDREIAIDREPHRVIAVAGNVHAAQPAQGAYRYVYLPIWSRDAKDARLFVSVQGRAAPLLEPLRRAIVSVDPDVHVGQESTLAGRTEMSFQRERLLAMMFEFTGAVALVLGAIGLYGLVSYQVSRRTREIAIRMALGAQRRAVIAWMMRRGLVAAGAGLGAGTLAGWQAAPVLGTFLYGVRPTDGVTFGVVVAVLGGVALAASYFPARHVSHVNPAAALKQQ